MTGDNNLYLAASNWFLDSESPWDLVYYSTKMAYRHQHAKAFYDIFEIYNYYSNNKYMDSSFSYYLLYNLAKAHELGHEIRKEEKLNGQKINIHNIRSSSFYLAKMNADIKEGE